MSVRVICQCIFSMCLYSLVCGSHCSGQQLALKLRDGDGEREREREKPMDRQTDRQTDRSRQEDTRIDRMLLLEDVRG